jgi:hypothetical protein
MGVSDEDKVGVLVGMSDGSPVIIGTKVTAVDITVGEANNNCCEGVATILTGAAIDKGPEQAAKRNPRKRIKFCRIGALSSLEQFFKIGDFLGSPTKDVESRLRQEIQAGGGDLLSGIGLFKHLDDIAAQSVGTPGPM